MDTKQTTNKGSASQNCAYIEKDCVFEHEGRKFESGGAVVTLDVIVAYPKENGILGDWHGNEIGTWKYTAAWNTPRSCYSSHMYQIEANVNGRTYTGRGAGIGMIYKGKLKK